MRIRDRDGNVGEVSEVFDEGFAGRSHGYLVRVSANGMWLTPAQAMRFALAIRNTADRVLEKRARSKR